MKEDNILGKVANLRDTFLEAEKARLEELKKNRQVMELMDVTLSRLPATQLARMALERIEKIETGKVPEEKLEQFESEIIIILASIEDKQIEKMKERTKDPEDFEIGR